MGVVEEELDKRSDSEKARVTTGRTVKNVNPRGEGAVAGRGMG